MKASYCKKDVFCFLPLVIASLFKKWSYVHIFTCTTLLFFLFWPGTTIESLHTYEEWAICWYQQKNFSTIWILFLHLSKPLKHEEGCFMHVLDAKWSSLKERYIWDSNTDTHTHTHNQVKDLILNVEYSGN